MSDIYKSIPDSLIKAAKGVMEQNTDLRAEQELASHGFSINEKNDYLETDLKKRKKNNDKAIKDMKKMGSPMKNPAFGEEVELTKEEQEFIDSLNNDIFEEEEIEIAEANYYIATSEKSKFHDKGYRPHLKNPQGKTSYLASVAYKSHEHAAGEAAAYHKGYTSGPGKASERGANDAVRAYRHKNKEHMHEEIELDDVDPKALKMKFKNRKDKDIDNDGDVDDSDKYLHKRRKAISKNIDEDAEQIDEISGKTLASYSDKVARYGPMKDVRTRQKHEKGVYTAYKKMKGKDVKVPARMEEVEQIDEISRKTLRSYIDKSGESMKQKGRGRPSRAFSAKKAKRSAGIETAKLKINDKNEKEWDEMDKSRENTISTVHSYILTDGPKKAGYSKFNSSGDRTIFVKKGPNGHLLYLEVYNNTDKYSGRFGKIGNSGSYDYSNNIYVNDLVPWKLRGNSDPKEGIEQFNKLIKQNEKVRD
jgi:hypothetical protein